MNDSIYLSIQNSPRFKELVRKREKFAWILSAIMLGLYSGFILLIAYGPHILGAKMTPESTITWGIPIGVGLILSAFVLTGIYVRRANGEFDDLNNAILKEAQQ
ncbi:DUF485 domain-containing protein [Pseudomonas sp. SWRI154]|uniref:DUF485 domain-containing protein n=1 Tax=Pseudomonas sp. SWRI154 TaxID=2745501 RepID=UPI001646F95F|nr:DUF485 domain-containing protein [Pseudomonas sp. SWRI154]MBC3363845.1 DUF485 domain-containing protein [Pseudomonas sp. SWRI154]